MLREEAIGPAPSFDHHPRFGVFRTTVPLFFDLVRPCAEAAPGLFEDMHEPLMYAFFTVYLVRPTAFRHLEVDIPRPSTVSDEAIVDQLVYMHESWLKKPDRATSFAWHDGKIELLWPTIEAALRYLEPSLPPRLRIKQNFNRLKVLKNSDRRAYLATLTCLVLAATNVPS